VVWCGTWLLFLHSENSAARSSICKLNEADAGFKKRGQYHLVTTQVDDQIVDTRADESDNRCLRHWVLVDGGAFAEAGVEDCKSGRWGGKILRCSVVTRGCNCSCCGVGAGEVGGGGRVGGGGGGGGAGCGREAKRGRA
jgi:hypothetical protein